MRNKRNKRHNRNKRNKRNMRNMRHTRDKRHKRNTRNKRNTRKNLYEESEGSPGIIYPGHIKRARPGLLFPLGVSFTGTAGGLLKQKAGDIPSVSKIGKTANSLLGGLCLSGGKGIGITSPWRRLPLKKILLTYPFPRRLLSYKSLRYPKKIQVKPIERVPTLFG